MTARRLSCCGGFPNVGPRNDGKPSLPCGLRIRVNKLQQPDLASPPKNSARINCEIHPPSVRRYFDHTNGTFTIFLGTFLKIDRGCSFAMLVYWSVIPVNVNPGWITSWLFNWGGLPKWYTTAKIGTYQGLAYESKLYHQSTTSRINPFWGVADFPKPQVSLT